MTEAFDAQAIFDVLGAHGVDYVTVGGIALQAHGAQRLTQDLDIVFDPSPENAARLAAALAALDAKVVGPDGRPAGGPPSAGLLGSSDLWKLVTPYGPIDAMTPPAALGRFADLAARAHRVALGAAVVPVAAREDLLAMKRQADRPQDREDVRFLEALPDGE